MDDRVSAAVTPRPIGLEDCNGLVRGSDGALVIFTGVVRDSTDGVVVSSLDYESYSKMAEEQMCDIAEQALSRWDIGRVLMFHRVGSLKVGEISVLVGVTAPHRQAAFEACRFCIDTLKDTVAIWKREVFADGRSRWVAQP